MQKIVAMLAVTAFAIFFLPRPGSAQSEWNDIVAAAKREGTVVVVGSAGQRDPPGADA